MRRSLVPAAAGGALVVVAGLTRVVRARRTPPPPPSPPPAVATHATPVLPASDPAQGVVERLEPDLPAGVAEAYRAARRAYNQARETGEGWEELHARARVLWWAATYAEQPARWLARDTRALLALLEERRDLLQLEQAAGEGGYVGRRVAKAERAIATTGRALFAIKPAKVRARIADA